MALLNVNPTRMALMDLKRRTKSAQRGHKLLKDKQDGLMQQFLAIIREAKELRQKVEEEVGEAFKKFLLASAWLTDAELENALSSPQAIIKAGASLLRAMASTLEATVILAKGFASVVGVPSLS